MAEQLNLQPNEQVVLEARPGAHRKTPRQTVGQASAQDLILTNLHILVVVKGTWSGRRKEVYPFPLAQITMIQGSPRLAVSGRNLDVYFHHGCETFEFASRKEVKAWVEAIRYMLTGGASPQEGVWDSAIPGAAFVAESLKDTVGVFKSTFGAKAEPKPTMVAGRCTSCGAPVSGMSGRVVRCEYCDSDQQL